MHLHEEYITRHRLKIPVIRYDSHATVFLRSKETPTFWSIMTVKWNGCHWHPGSFKITIEKPLHDRADNLHQDFPQEVYWDEYEEHLLTFCQGLKCDFVAVSQKESELAAWCMFLTMYDSYLAKLSAKVLNKIAGSIRPENSLAQRHLDFMEARLSIQQEQYALVERLEKNIMPLTNKYADWLVELING